MLLSEVACDGGATVAVAGGNDLAVGLNEHRVSQSFASTERRADKPPLPNVVSIPPLGR